MKCLGEEYNDRIRTTRSDVQRTFWLPRLPSVHIILGLCSPDTKEERSAKVTDAICEFLALKVADIQYATPAQAN